MKTNSVSFGNLRLEIPAVLLAFAVGSVLSQCQSQSGPIDSADDGTGGDETGGDDDGLDTDGFDDDDDAVDDDDDDDDNDNDDDNDDNDNNDTDTQTETDDICYEWDVAINIQPVRMMILQDLSTSMLENNSAKWIQSKAALDNLFADFDELVQFGYDIFPNHVPFETDACFVDDPLLLDTEPQSGQKIADYFNGIEPNGLTPLYTALRRYTEPDYAPKLKAPDGAKYLLVIADGDDSCGLEGMQLNDVTPADLSDITGQILGLDIKTFVIGFAIGSGNPDQLNAIAAAGGTPFDTYFDAQDQQELEEVLEEIADITVDCVYDIEPQDDTVVDYDEVAFYFDDVEIGYDKDCQFDKGWTWVDDTHAQVKFCKEACDQLKTGTVKAISATFGCVPDIIIE